MEMLVLTSFHGDPDPPGTRIISVWEWGQFCFDEKTFAFGSPGWRKDMFSEQRDISWIFADDRTMSVLF